MTACTLQIGECNLEYFFSSFFFFALNQTKSSSNILQQLQTLTDYPIVCILNYNAFENDSKNSLWTSDLQFCLMWWIREI